MSATKSARIDSLAVLVQTAITGATAAPTAAPSAARLALFARAMNGQYVPDFATIAIDANSGPATLTGPVDAYGWDIASSKWRRLGSLNGGADIVIVAIEQGFEQRARELFLFGDIAIATPGIAAGTVNVTVTPLEIIGTGA